MRPERPEQPLRLRVAKAAGYALLVCVVGAFFTFSAGKSSDSWRAYTGAMIVVVGVACEFVLVGLLFVLNAGAIVSILRNRGREQARIAREFAGLPDVDGAATKAPSTASDKVRRSAD